MLVKHSKRTVRSGCETCGDTDLYWAHDTDITDGQMFCTDCEVTGKKVLIDRDNFRHKCTLVKSSTPKEDPMDDDDPFNGAVPWNEPKPAKEEVWTPAVFQPAAPVADEAAAFAAFKALLTPQAAPIDEAKIREIVGSIVDSTLFPTRTVVVREGVAKPVQGDTHKMLGDVVTVLLSGEHAMMVGPAGTGKSTIAEQAAEALGLPSYSISLSPQTPASAIIGYMQAAGEYVRTLFRDAYENGGVFHFDEVDNSHPSVLAVINAALANGHMAFPDGMVKRHDDFRCVASANTYGKGATRQYVGRQAMDAATLDRFTILTIEIDEALENSLCHSVNGKSETVIKVLAYVRQLRQNVDKAGLQVVISPRASVGMCRLLDAGMDWNTAVNARVRRGLDDATWRKVEGR